MATKRVTSSRAEPAGLAHTVIAAILVRVQALEPASFDAILPLVPAPSAAGHMAFVHAVLEGSAPGFVLVKLHDNGSGMTGDLSNIGKPFFRPYSGSGSGIGLYLIRTLAKKLGGS